jgi:hypothetical protein
MDSNYAAAFVLLGGLVVVLIAGVAAVDASYEQTDQSLSDAGEPSPGVLGMGEDLWSSVFTALPWLALAAVPLGIIGILGAVAYTQAGRRRGVGR